MDPLDSSLEAELGLGETGTPERREGGQGSPASMVTLCESRLLLNPGLTVNLGGRHAAAPCRGGSRKRLRQLQPADMEDGE